MPRILIADSNALVACGLQATLRSHGLNEVVGQARSEDELMAQIEAFQPDLVILDFVAPGFSVETIVRLKAMKRLRVLALTDAQRGVTLVHALRAGVDGYVKKDCDLQEIVEAVRETDCGRKFFCSQILETIRKEGINLESLDVVDPDCGGVSLSKRELEVICLIAEGFTNPQISEKLFVSPHTVTTHRRNILNKLGANNTAAVVLYAVQAGLVSPNKFLFAPEA
ncbi:MAG: DNA-binding response regulator [Crocinitomicaceae bacterium TMED114]|nr:MAG: DNA-binding response regulator [Crocinitomicaceae bacterium TMED114]